MKITIVTGAFLPVPPIMGGAVEKAWFALVAARKVCRAKMKITIVTGAFLPVPPIMGGAVEKAWFALGREFARRGQEIVFISRKLPQLPADETADGVKDRKSTRL